MTIRAAHHHPILGNQNLLSYFPNIGHLDTFTCLYSEILCSKSVYILEKKKKITTNSQKNYQIRKISIFKALDTNWFSERFYQFTFLSVEYDTK